MNFWTSRTDPLEEFFADPAFLNAYLDAVVADYTEAAAFDPSAFDESGFDEPSYVDAPEAPTLLDELLQAEDAVKRTRAASAEQDDLFHRVLVRAEADPTPWVGADPTDDPAWEPPGGWTVAAYRARRRNLAVRAAAADLAVRVRLSDNQVRLRAHRAGILSTRCPQTWQAYLNGTVSEQNARVVAELAATLPDDDTPAWRAFDDDVASAAAELAPAVFRRRAAAARERAHPEPLEARHAQAAARRSVTFASDIDAMGSVFAQLPAATVHAIEEQVEDRAQHLACQPDETRTLEQLRADVFSDLLLSDADGAGTRNAATAVRITIPALTLLGHSDEPATIDGYGPIDLDTARRLAGSATSWIRVLTHPVSGTVLDVDRTTYRPPADLRRWLGILHPTCTFPGCTRPSHRCDIDHRQRWADGGTTSADNLGPKSPNHHTLKDETLWTEHRDPATGRQWWVSPTGIVTDVDPPPF